MVLMASYLMVFLTGEASSCWKIDDDGDDFDSNDEDGNDNSNGMFADEAESPDVGWNECLPCEAAGWRRGSEEWDWGPQLAVQQVSQSWHTSIYYCHGYIAAD